MSALPQSALRASAFLLTAAAALLLFTPPVRAAVPSAANSTVQNVIVGSWNGASMPTCTVPCGAKHAESFIVIVRDVANVPIPGAAVTVVCTGTGLSVTALQNPGVSVDCMSHTLKVTTDASGTAKFTPHFGGHLDTPGVSVFASGVFLASVTAASADYDGDARITLADFTAFVADYLSPAYFARSDFDNCPDTRLPDLTYMAAQYLASQGTQLAPVCP